MPTIFTSIIHFIIGFCRILTQFTHSMLEKFVFFYRKPAYVKAYTDKNSYQATLIRTSERRGSQLKWLMILGLAFSLLSLPCSYSSLALADQPSTVSINKTSNVDGLEDAARALIKPFCAVINLLTGTVGKTIIVLILISLVIMLFLGKVSWGLALTFLFGVGLLFSAPTLVDMLGGGSDNKVSAICGQAMRDK